MCVNDINQRPAHRCCDWSVKPHRRVQKRTWNPEISAHYSERKPWPLPLGAWNLPLWGIRPASVLQEHQTLVKVSRRPAVMQIQSGGTRTTDPFTRRAHKDSVFGPCCRTMKTLNVWELLQNKPAADSVFRVALMRLDTHKTTGRNECHGLTLKLIAQHRFHSQTDGLISGQPWNMMRQYLGYFKISNTSL